jgi:nicotinamide-nucleotide amidase
MNPVLEIFSQGEEITRGQIADTNAAWLSQQVIDLGFNVTRHTAVGDKLDDLVALLKEIAQRADCCLCTGGLGPTSDDLTAEAVAKAFDLPLQFDEFAYAQMQQYFARRKRTMPVSNYKQALLPTGAVRLDNDAGTAPGFAVKFQRCWFAFMPGVPSEMRQMYMNKISPLLPERFSLQPGRLITLKTIGLGESALQEQIAAIAIPNVVQLGYRAAEDVQIKLLFPFAYPESAIAGLVATFADSLGDCVYAIEGFGEHTGDLATAVDTLMQRGGHTLAVIETISHGLLAAKCVGVDWLLHASYEPSLPRLAAKYAIQASNDDVLAIATDIARQMQQQHDVDFVLIQLCTEDSGTNDKNQSINVLSVLLAADKIHHALHSISGTPQRKQLQAALMSLDTLRRSFGAGHNGLLVC